MSDHAQRISRPSHPERIGRYEVLARLACGAMGVVYMARAQSVGGFERRVAIKVLHPHLAQRPQIVSMLLTEARLAAQILHPNAVSVLDVDVTDSGEHYVVMDYVDGFTLCELLDHPRLDAVRRVRLGLRILLDATQGVDAAHRLCSVSDGSPLGIVHRDVSPSNIMCSLQGIGFITDFGIARVAAEDTDSMPGVIKGTPCYMAPEQISGSERLDARADVWSLGAVLWEVLTGEQLFFSPHGIGGVLSLVLTGHVPRPSTHNSRVPEALDALCEKALRRDPAERLSSARELADALERIAREHDLVASTHETEDALAQLFADAIAERRSGIPPLASLAAPAAPAAPAPAGPTISIVLPTDTEPVPAPTPRGSHDTTAAELEIARLRLRRPPWMTLAVAACALLTVVTLLLVDGLSPRSRTARAPETSQHEPPHGLLPADPALLRFDSPPDAPAPEAMSGPRPTTRHIAFAPSVVTADEQSRRPHGDDAVEVEPNPYLQR